jgi:hypothetical protein
MFFFHRVRSRHIFVSPVMIDMSRPYYRFPFQYGQVVPPQLPAAVTQIMPDYMQNNLTVLVLSGLAGIPTIVVAVALLWHGLKFRGDDEIMLFAMYVILWKIRFLPIAEVGKDIDPVHHMGQPQINNKSFSCLTP